MEACFSPLRLTTFAMLLVGISSCRGTSPILGAWVSEQRPPIGMQFFRDGVFNMELDGSAEVGHYKLLDDSHIMLETANEGQTVAGMHYSGDTLHLDIEGSDRVLLRRDSLPHFRSRSEVEVETRKHTLVSDLRNMAIAEAVYMSDPRVDPAGAVGTAAQVGFRPLIGDSLVAAPGPDPGSFVITGTNGGISCSVSYGDVSRVVSCP